VVLVGFYAGGKTWFLNRLKHELGRWGFNLSPPPARDKERVIRTVNVEIHHARRLSDDQVRGFAVVDIPGRAADAAGGQGLPLGEVGDRGDGHVRRADRRAARRRGAAFEDVQREAQVLRGVDHVLLKRTRQSRSPPPRPEGRASWWSRRDRSRTRSAARA
jgi:hypothetical protein